MRHTNTITGAAAARVCLPAGRVKTCGEEKVELDVSISVTSTAISVSTHRGLVTGHVRRRGMRNRPLPVLGEECFFLLLPNRVMDQPPRLGHIDPALSRPRRCLRSLRFEGTRLGLGFVRVGRRRG